MSLTSLTALELGAKIRSGEAGVEEAVRDALAQIEQKEPDIHSFVTVDAQGALQRAREVQKKISAGELKGPLAGDPAAVLRAPWRESPWPSRTICAQKGCGLPAAQKCFRGLCRVIRQRLSCAWNGPEPL